jgi:glycosyltransferase involved in cell wall biosynthesis
MPVVSVVVIFLNEERFLEEAVRSIRDQTLADWELILVDDGSTDQSTSIARDLAAQDERICYVDHPGHENQGRSASRNLGAAHATGSYIMFLDGDDVCVPSKLAEQVELLESMPDVALVCGALLYWHSWDTASTKADHNVLTGGVANRRLDPPDAALTMYPLARAAGAGPDLFVRRSVFDAVGGFEERFPGMYDDQAFLIKVFLRYPVYISSRTWLRYRQHDASCCAQTTRTDYWRLRRLFLDWLAEDAGRLEDPRVNIALRRARREIPYRRLTAPAYNAYDRLRDRLPAQFKGRVKRAFAAPSARLKNPSTSDRTGIA